MPVHSGNIAESSGAQISCSYALGQQRVLNAGVSLVSAKRKYGRGLLHGFHIPLALARRGRLGFKL